MGASSGKNPIVWVTTSRENPLKLTHVNRTANGTTRGRVEHTKGVEKSLVKELGKLTL